MKSTKMAMMGLVFSHIRVLAMGVVVMRSNRDNFILAARKYFKLSAT